MGQAAIVLKKAALAETQQSKIDSMRREMQVLVSENYVKVWAAMCLSIMKSPVSSPEVRAQAAEIHSRVTGFVALPMLRNDIYSLENGIEDKVRIALEILEAERPFLSELALAAIKSLAVWRAQLRVYRHHKFDCPEPLVLKESQSALEAKMDSGARWALEYVNERQSRQGLDVEGQLVLIWLMFLLNKRPMREMVPNQLRLLGMLGQKLSEDTAAVSQVNVGRVEEQMELVISRKLIVRWREILQEAVDGNSDGQPVKMKAQKLL
jgi:hypothetical protein